MEEGKEGGREGGRKGRVDGGEEKREANESEIHRDRVQGAAEGSNLEVEQADFRAVGQRRGRSV